MRVFDILASCMLIIVLIPLFLIISLIIFLSFDGPILHFSKRVGRFNENFMMPKFRTMKLSSPDIATHLLENPEKFVTPIGSILRRYSLDELPQLYSIFVGRMSFVGPRPALHNQEDLIELRTSLNIHKIRPGLTGLAQINGRDEISIDKKVELDYYYLQNKSFLLDLKIIFLTFFKVFKKSNISH